MKPFSLKKTKPQYEPVILITGCSSGIGFALAKKLHELHRYRVVATVRESSIESLKALLPENERFLIEPLDVTSQDDRARLIRRIYDVWHGVDILVNNAGISYRSVVEHMTDEDEIKQLETNYLGPMGLIRLVLPYMRSQGRGKIINISSVSGMLAMPTMASYSASKHALEGASEALWYEMKPLGINVSLVQPGFVHSDSFNNVYYSALAKLTEKEGGPYGDYYQQMTPFIARMMNRSETTPEKVAKRIIWIIKKENPPLRVPATMDAVFFYYLRRWIPRRFFHPFLFWCLPNARLWGKNYSKARASGKWKRWLK